MLFLFDIDGTLLRRLPPSHRKALCDACYEVFKVRARPEEMGRTAGMTDTAILMRLLHGVGVPRAEIAPSLPRLYAAAADAYDRLVDADLSMYHTPHAAEALAWLARRGAALGLVTGNIQRIAWRKLGAARLAEPFTFGAFGDEAEARDELPPIAVRRGETLLGRAFTPRQVYVVGDTPADIGCGVAAGLRTIAVATGPEHTMEHLRAYAPDYLLEDLRGLLALDL